jgi:hypothetical protein
VELIWESALERRARLFKFLFPLVAARSIEALALNSAALDIVVPVAMIFLLIPDYVV